jgi:hypothetical protein
MPPCNGHGAAERKLMRRRNEHQAESLASIWERVEASALCVNRHQSKVQSPPRNETVKGRVTRLLDPNAIAGLSKRIEH